ncbi:MAG: L-seryl-tRNA(Sec) selenium transferase [Alcaligenaceae bacterium]|nr:L-seryl-tRNA(Sec) selenium transferase [Alcaligenaceae bacterium]
MTQTNNTLSFSDLPSVDKLLSSEPFKDLITNYGHSQVSHEVREALKDLRQKIHQQETLVIDLKAVSVCTQFAEIIAQALQQSNQSRLRSVFNLTGVVLHTNLGRALLPEVAVEAVVEAMRNPMNLEYDLASGGRGDRDDLIEELLCELTGAEAATVVNNNAAAVLLMLNALAYEREVVVSRGELVEIGGSFRIPDIMKRANSRLVEIGTTNRTHARDYEEAISADTAMLMKVHCSNYEISGFTKEVTINEVAAIAKKHGLPATVDLGSGTLVDLTKWGLPPEVTVRQTIEAGADIVTFSGDKLLGGPQAGLIVGRADLIAKIKKNPLKRALRVGKITLAALEPILQLYRSPELLAQRLTTLRLFTRSQQEIEQTAAEVLTPVRQWVGENFAVSAEGMMSQIGSGAMPVEQLPSHGLAIRYIGQGRPGRHLIALEVRLRQLPKPVIARIAEDTLLLDLRCLETHQQSEFIEQLQQNLKSA